MVFLNKEETNWRYLFVVALVALLAGAIIINSSKKGPSFEFMEIKRTPKGSVVEQGEKKESENKSDWNAYENKVWGFLLKYPQDWKITNATLPTKPKETLINENLEIGNLSIPQAPKLTIWVDPLGFDPPPFDIQYNLATTSDGGIKIESRIEIPQSEENRNKDYKTVIFAPPIKLGLHTFAFLFEFKGRLKNYEPTFQEILSTFKIYQ